MGCTLKCLRNNAPESVTLELGEIVVLADESVLVQHVEFFSGGELFVTEHARETLEMVDA